ncbi:hypothetical protein AB2J22_03645 [Aeromonas sp. A5]|uniref:hypothetical protein n=1 Tax=unclassified Aeromonas TaxID=257493 RepID=UPI0037704FB9
MKTLFLSQVTIIFLLILGPLVYGFGWNGMTLCARDEKIKVIASIMVPFVNWENFYDDKEVIHMVSGVLLRISPTKAVVLSYKKKSNINNVITDEILIDKHVSGKFGVFNNYGFFKLSKNTVTIKTEYGFVVNMRIDNKSCY